MDDDCEEWVPFITVLTAETTVEVKQEAVILHIFCIRDFNTSTGASREDLNRISDSSFLIAFDSNYLSILVFTIRPQDRRPTDVGAITSSHTI